MTFLHLFPWGTSVAANSHRGLLAQRSETGDKSLVLFSLSEVGHLMDHCNCIFHPHRLGAERLLRAGFKNVYYKEIDQALLSHPRLPGAEVLACFQKL